MWAMALSGSTMSPRRIPGLGRGTVPRFSESAHEDCGELETGDREALRPTTSDGEIVRFCSTPPFRFSDEAGFARLSKSIGEPAPFALRGIAGGSVPATRVAASILTEPVDGVADEIGVVLLW